MHLGECPGGRQGDQLRESCHRAGEEDNAEL